MASRSFLFPAAPGGWALVLAAALGLWAAVASRTSAAELGGAVTLVHRGKPVGPSTADPREVVITFHPTAGARPGAPGDFEIVTEGKEFHPRILAVPAGSRVGFPNRYPILHNVFSVSEGNRFDLGLYARGEGKAQVFAAPGVARIYCNVHHSMVAYVLVLDTPFVSRPGADGAFGLTGLPAGPGRLTAWHERTDPWSSELAVPSASPLSIRLGVTRPPVPPHLNKHGKTYSGRQEY